jgi:hypothetical protein
MSDFVVIGRYQNPVIAHLIKDRLEEEGITCFLQNSDSVFGTLIAELTLLVPRADLSHAAAVIKNIPGDAQELKNEIKNGLLFPDEGGSRSSDERPVICPKCRSAETRMNFSEFNKNPWGLNYHCFNCNSDFIH